MNSLALELIYILHDTGIREQEERQGTPVNSHMMDIVMRREEVGDRNLRPIRIAIFFRDGSNVVAGP